MPNAASSSTEAKQWQQSTCSGKHGATTSGGQGWLRKLFTSEADLQDEAALDAATLGSLAATAAAPKRARGKKKTAGPLVTAAEPGHLAAEPGHLAAEPGQLAAASSSSAAEPSSCKVSLGKPPADTAARQKRSAATAKKLPREPKRSKTSKKVVSKASSSSCSGSSSTSSSSSSDSSS